MSYDFVARRVPPGADARRAMEADAPDDGPADDPTWEHMRRVADALEAAVPGCERWESPGRGVIDLDADRMQVSVGAHEVWVMVPYWTLGSGRDGVDRVDAFVAALVEQGYTVWDPQTEEILDPRTAPRQASDGYRSMAPAALRALGDVPSPPRWKFWKR